MSVAIAQAAINTYLQLNNGQSPEVFSNVSNVGDITGPTWAGQVVDVTSHSTANAWRQKIVTLLDPGIIGTKCYFIPNDSTSGGHQYLLSIFFNRGLPTAPQVQCDWRLSWPTVPARTVLSFSAFLSKFSITAPVASVIEAAVELVLVGEPSYPGVDA
jgi:hypothetical protein